ncbi:MAG: glycosyltransferase [Pyrinomonadaceae bacterium]
MNCKVSIVIAVLNGSAFLKKSLPAVIANLDADSEIILVDDGSSDDSAALGKQFGAEVITLENPTGAANARNIGVKQARGEIILFIDADVVIKTNTIRNIRELFAANPGICALFGSYDDAPDEPGFFSQYRNLMHHFFHQTGNSEAETFWSGFGAIKRDVFLKLGGFDAEKFEIPSVEDIELGYRLKETGCRILLVPELQAKHLKRWTFYSILRTDFWQRAVPWVELLLLNPHIKPDLNAKVSQKASAVLAGIFILSLIVVFWNILFLIAALVSLTGLLFINREFYAFFLRRKGLFFTIRVFPMHLLYFCYSSAAFIYSWINIKLLGRSIIVR